MAELEATDPLDTLKSAVLVAKALELWHAGGASAGDVRFWAPHVELFDSPKAYALVVESLLERDDFIASMALLIHWLGQAHRVGLHKGEASFSDLAAAGCSGWNALPSGDGAVDWSGREVL